MDVRRAIDHLRTALDVDDAASRCRASRVLEAARVVADGDGLRVTDRGETGAAFEADPYHPAPDDATLAGTCARFGVGVVRREGELYRFGRRATGDRDVREPVHALLAAEDAGGVRDENVLRAGRGQQLSRAEDK
jgi:hypothetical protein